MQTMVRGAAEIREFLADGMSAVDSAGVPLITERDEAFVHRATTLLSKHGFAAERQSVLYLTDDYGWQECAAISMGMDPMELRDKFEARYHRLVFGKRRQGETRSDYYKRVAGARREKADGLDQDDWVSLQMEEALAGSGYQSPATISKAAEALGGGLAAVAMTPREHRAVAVCWREPGTFNEITLDVKAGRFYEHDVDLEWPPVHWCDSSLWVQRSEAIKKARERGIEPIVDDHGELVTGYLTDEAEWFDHMDEILGEAAAYRENAAKRGQAGGVQADSGDDLSC